MAALCPNMYLCSPPGEPAGRVSPGDVCVGGRLRMGAVKAPRPSLMLHGDIWPRLMVFGYHPSLAFQFGDPSIPLDV